MNLNLINIGISFNVILSLLITDLLFSQDLSKYPIYSITEEDGLPSNEVYNAIEDQNGFIWFATDNGVSKFNGRSHLIFDSRNGLPDNSVYHLFNQPDTSIVGVCASGQFFRIKNDAVQLLIQEDTSKKYLAPVSFPFSFYEDEKSNFHIGTRAGYYCFDRHSNLLKIDTSAHPKHKRINYWMTPQGKVFCYQISTNNEASSDSVLLEHNGKALGIYSINESINRSIYPSIHDSLIVIPLEKTVFVVRKGASQVKKIDLSIKVLGSELCKNILYLNTDGEGVFIYYLEGDSLHFKNQILEDLSTSSTLVSRKGIYWFTTLENGVNFIKPEQSQIAFTAEDDENITSFAVSNNSLVVGHESGLINIPGKYKDFPTENKIYEIFDWKNQIYTVSGELFVFNEQFEITSFFNDIQKANKASSKKSLFLNKNTLITSAFNSVSIWRRSTNDIEKVKALDNSLLINDIECFGDSCIVSCSDKTVIFDVHQPDKFSSYKTAFKIIHFFDHEGNIYGLGDDVKLYRFKSDTFEVHEIPPVLDINGALSGRYQDGILHISTNKGVYSWKIKDKGQKIELIGFEPIPLVKSMKIVHDTLFCATKKIIYKKALKDISISLPTLYISNIKVNDKMTTQTENLTLTYRENNIEFQLNAFSFDQPLVNYRYRLSGHDEKYFSTAENTINYSSLAPGDYRFIISATSDGISYSKEKIIYIQITPPYWTSWWFIVLVTILILAIISWLVIIRIKRIRHKVELKQLISKLKSQALMAQLNPHLVFNVLNSIQGMVSEGEIESSNAYIARFSKFLRNSLNYSKLSSYSIEKEIRMTNAYIELEKLRFLETIRFTIKNEIKNPETPVPPLVTQPLIENAIKHGVMPDDTVQKKIEVHFYENDGFLCIEVRDNGAGMKSDFNQGDGIRITRERLLVLHEENELNIISQHDPTIFQLKLKL